METNELLEIWKSFLREYDDLKKRIGDVPFSSFLHHNYTTRQFWQLKAKMDLQDALIKEQKKQILSMETDMEWFYNRGKEDMYLSKGQGRNFKDAWKIYSYGLKKGEKHGVS